MWILKVIIVNVLEAQKNITSQIIISASLLEENLRNEKFIIGKYYHNDETGKTLNFKSQIKLSDLIPQ